jgi:hypothetical protein
MPADVASGTQKQNSWHLPLLLHGVQSCARLGVGKHRCRTSSGWCCTGCSKSVPGSEPAGGRSAGCSANRPEPISGQGKTGFALQACYCTP